MDEAGKKTKEPVKQVVIKIHEDGRIELVKSDPGVAVMLLLPDNSMTEVFQDDKKIYEQHGEDWFPTRG